MSFDADFTDPFVAKAAELRALFDSDAAERDRAGGRPTQQIGLLKQARFLSAKLPRDFGGQDVPWISIFRAVREFAKTDGSLAHLFGYHHLPLVGILTRGSAEQKERWLRGSSQGEWFWGNSGNSMSKSLFGRDLGDHWILDGHRPFSSGTHVADAIQIAWEDRDTNQRWLAAIPADRTGLTIEDDWDGLGQTQTGSGTVSFRSVRVDKSEVIGAADVPLTPWTSLTPFLQQSVLLNVFVGSAQGALTAARDYTVTRSRPWIHSGVTRHQDDPWIQRTYGDLVIRTRAATELADRAARSLDAAWCRGPGLGDDERGRVAIDIAAANVFGGEVALDVTSRIFEVMGARSATRAQGFDRFWRNVRTHTLHNPAEYKARTVGAWFLTGEPPEPALYR